jgi:hypothetical protein
VAGDIEQIMADPTKIPVRGVSKLYPSPRKTGPMNPATPFRWVHRGVRGPDGSTVKLEAARIGGVLMTSQEALIRFFRKLNGPRGQAQENLPRRGRTPQARQRASERAAARLDGG